MASGKKLAREATVVFEGNRYSVPWHLAGRDVLLRRLPDCRHMHILWQDQVIARYPLATGHGQFVKDPAHYQGVQRGKAGRPALYLLDKQGPDEVERRDLAYYDQLAGVN